MRIAKRRGDYLLGRWTAKCAIATRISPAPPLVAIAVRASDDGAPEAFLDGSPLAFTVSLSHSAGRALAAVRCGGAALGADLERVEPRSALLVDNFFTADEAAQVAACHPDQRDRAITLIWSAKESALKARRTGLREDPRSVHVDVGDGIPAPDASWRALRVAIDGAPDALTGWWRDDTGYVLTVVGAALAGPPERCGHRGTR
jgi:4'-phosphopantetheinyl transferase